MSSKDERKLRVIETVKTETAAEPAKKTAVQTNPIARMFLKFHKENAGKFGVKDIFKK